MIEQIFLGRLKILPEECSSWLSGLDVPAQKNSVQPNISWWIKIYSRSMFIRVFCTS